MPFKGHFDSFFISKIFQFLNEETKTGVLTLESGERKAFILLRDGKIVYVQGCSDKNRLGKYFVREGIISDADLDRVVQIAEKKERAFGKILVELKLASIKDLKSAIEGQATEILYDVFTWDSGEFNFEDAEVDDRSMVFFELNVMKLIFDAARRIDELNTFERNIGSDDTVLKISENIKKQQTITLDAEAWQILSLIDGRRSLAQIVEMSDYSRFDVFKVVNALMSVELVNVCEFDRVPAPKQTNAGPAGDDTEKAGDERREKNALPFFSFFKKK